jgi:hypothetical protein
MPVLMRSHRGGRRRESESYLATPQDEPTYFLLVPSGALEDWTSRYRHTTRSMNRQPPSMLQVVTFNDDIDGDARVVRLRPVDEADNSW